MISSIAVMPFDMRYNIQSNESISQHLADKIGDMSYAIVTPKDARGFMKTLKFDYNEYFDGADARKFGNALHYDTVIFGAITRVPILNPNSDQLIDGRYIQRSKPRGDKESKTPDDNAEFWKNDVGNLHLVVEVFLLKVQSQEVHWLYLDHETIPAQDWEKWSTQEAETIFKKLALFAPIKEDQELCKKNALLATPFLSEAPPTVTVSSPQPVVTVTPPLETPKLASVAEQLLTFGKIEFDTNKAIIRKVSYENLDHIVDILNQNPDVKKIKIEAHTDSDGTEKANLDLSKRRAASVMAYFKTKGIADTRMTSEGFGESKPIAENTNPVGKSTNRRVEFVIIDPPYGKVIRKEL